MADRQARIVTPEQFGAVGDGVTDDAQAIQHAMDTLARGDGGTLWLEPRVAYRCATGLTLDASRVSLDGHALLDFSGWAGRYLRVTASSVAVPGRDAVNNYGHKGMIAGAIRLRGAGRDTTGIGVDFDSPVDGTNAAMLVENLSVSDCGTGIRFGSRGYNSVLVRCEIFKCGICIDWPTAEDNGERNTLLGCVLYNSGLAVRIALSSATFHLQGCSLDYTTRLYEVVSGSILAVSCHHESRIWEDRPIRCAGDGSFIRLDGGAILHQEDRWAAHHLVEVREKAAVHLVNTTAHNLALTAPDPTLPASFGTGAGELLMSGTQSFDASIMPPRLHAQTTRLSDPDFSAAGWEDTLWRLADTTMPITDRYGGDGDNLQLTRMRAGAAGGLLATKAGDAGTPASFVLLLLPVRYGESVLAGFRVRSDPRRPGGNPVLLVSPTWFRLDGQDAGRIPVVTRSHPVGIAAVTATGERFIPVAPLGSRSQRSAPHWATHFGMVVDLSRAHRASFLFNGLWADTI